MLCFLHKNCLIVNDINIFCYVEYDLQKLTIFL